MLTRFVNYFIMHIFVIVYFYIKRDGYDASAYKQCNINKAVTKG